MENVSTITIQLKPEVDDVVVQQDIERKIIAGYWQDEDVQARIGSWMKAAIGVAVSKDMKVMRFGDNMRMGQCLRNRPRERLFRHQAERCGL
jgi:hypothetical protein